MVAGCLCVMFSQSVVVYTRPRSPGAEVTGTLSKWHVTLAMFGYFAWLLACYFSTELYSLFATAITTVVACQINQCHWPSCKIVAP